ncbi:two-partner secretion domain-containing protein [Anabaena sp. WFMT]|uniref:two-partner secretion domain-containing protein n=1 Tax=Anabaena sp. WFMT TaxID=3449730 RepID=UPI003F252CDF
MLEYQTNPYIHSQITNKAHIFTFSLGFFALLISPIIAKKAIAQIVPDNTLPINSQVQPGCKICQINGGTVRGVNLFHSFQEFSVPKNGQALFNNSLEIQNILTRVTGNSISNIDGLIRTNGNAHLFLINPKGIIFGDNAYLKIGGSFTATTVNSLKFFDGSEFSATNPQAPPLLTVNITPGLQYGESPTGAKITNLGNLSVGQDFDLVTDQLDMQGEFNAGNNLTLQATANLQMQNSIITAAGGNLNIYAGELNLINTTINSNASTSGGEMAIHVRDSATLINSILRMQSMIGQTPGNISIEANQVTIKDQSLIYADQQGSITISANRLSLDNQAQVTANTVSEISGDIQLLNLKSLQLTNNSSISSVTINGEAGDITIHASDFIQLDSGSLLASGAVGEGNAGNIAITTRQLTMNNGAKVNVSSVKNAGQVFLIADTVTLDNQASIDANTFSGIGGDITLQDLKSLQLSNNSAISASTVNGEAGDITINVSDFIKFDSGSRLVSEAVGAGNAGFIDITTGQFTMSNGADINVNSQGNIAGYLRLSADTVTLDDARIEANTGSGIGGDIQLVDLKSLQLSNNSFISASTEDGEAGDITINASDFIKLNSASTLASGSPGQGNAGFIDITTGQFTMTDGARVTVSSKDNTGGYLRLTANSVNLDNQSQITGETASGIGGDIELLDLKSLQLSNNSYISASTIDGEAGDVTIQASDFIKLDSGSRLASQAADQGNAGFVDITTGQLSINNGARVTVSSKNGIGGYLELLANTVTLDHESQIIGETASGIGGDIRLLDLQSLQLSNNSSISASTDNGEAGDVTINANDFIKLDSDSRIASEVTGQGDAGYVDITTGQFTIINKSIVTVSSPSGLAGYLAITANNLFLNQGFLAAETGVGEGGDNATINLFVQDLLLMKNNTRISAQAFGTAQGGNIFINAQSGFVVALPFENSDITANADQGNGGNINITTQGIFGTEYRLQSTPKSDITASSQFGLNGDVSINVLSIDPSQGLLSLPTSLVDVSNQIAQGCAAGSKLASSKNKFTVAGRGGIPSSPDDLLTGTTALVELVDLVPSQNNQENIKPIGVNSSSATEMMEAQGWIFDSNGQVHLVAKVENALPHSPVLTLVSCSTP